MEHTTWSKEKLKKQRSYRGMGDGINVLLYFNFHPYLIWLSCNITLSIWISLTDKFLFHSLVLWIRLGIWCLCYAHSKLCMDSDMLKVYVLLSLLYPHWRKKRTLLKIWHSLCSPLPKSANMPFIFPLILWESGVDSKLMDGKKFM